MVIAEALIINHQPGTDRKVKEITPCSSCS